MAFAIPAGYRARRRFLGYQGRTVFLLGYVQATALLGPVMYRYEYRKIYMYFIVCMNVYAAPSHA
jgi:hypothetical protein